ncbi:threonine ammonia-lyase [Arcicella rosea]|uniref:L-threonine dehydratase n=1 Tax=Arcicella rosea TaxID=502909 RepID=A0A841EJK1_9BACT|nr:threonine ammonia-lyase [Arcicella rosea]MBB6001579.1 threonine dehydratase [Arcicella rosea]
MANKTDQKNDSIFPTLESIYEAAERLRGVAVHTPLTENIVLSERYEANIFLKREDLQIVRSYKIRGAYNKMARLSAEELAKGVVCASAGNHAQGMAYACHKMKVKGTIFMPTTTPNQKIKQVKMFGKDDIEVMLVGDTYDDASNAAKQYCDEHNATYVHPFDDMDVITGQATVGLEIFKDSDFKIDYIILAIGGGGVSAGVSTVFKQLSPHTKIIGVEPAGAASMKASFEAGHVIELETIDKFVDGAAVKRVGEKTFNICKETLDNIILVPEGKVCTTILELYNESAIVAEPAGALTIAALDFMKDEIKGKNVVCLVSGGNNDITRTEEIKERSLLYEGLKHYFIIRFPQRAGALKNFLNNVLGEEDDITLFEYQKKTNRESGPVLLGIELKHKEDYEPLLARMVEQNIVYQKLNEQPDLFSVLV